MEYTDCASSRGKADHAAMTTKAHAAMTDETATHRVNANTPRNTTTTTRAASGDTPRIAPREVATPLPPRPFSHGDQQWPITAARPATRGGRPPKGRNAKVGSNPLRMSMTATSTPHLRPRTRPTFVAPGLPEPSPRMSWPSARASQVAGDIEPTA